MCLYYGCVLPLLLLSTLYSIDSASISTRPSTKRTTTTTAATTPPTPVCPFETHFRCNTDHNCVPKSWLCDGMDDCNDGSDELFCVERSGTPLPDRATYDRQSLTQVGIGGSSSPSPHRPAVLQPDDVDVGGAMPDRAAYMHTHQQQSLGNCTRDEFRCRGTANKCVPLSVLCDRVPNCPDGDDEGGQCDGCIHFGCEKHCVNSPLGPTCLCDAGFELAGDEKSCTDIDECEHDAGCAHFCTNTHGSYECTCSSGFRLDSDRRSCLLENTANGSVIVAVGHEVYSMSLYDSTSTVPATYQLLMSNDEAGALVHGIDYVNDKLYLSLATVGGKLGSIQSHDMREQSCIVDHVTGIINVAVDWVTGNIYYAAAAPSTRPGIGVCSGDGRYCRLLFSDKDMVRCRGFVLHPKRGLMFWSSWGDDGPKIEQAYMDGTGRRVLVRTKIEWPNGLAMDYINEQLYFGDAQLQFIERIDIFTLKRTMVTTQGVHHPYDLAVFNGHVYWTDWYMESVIVAELRNVTYRHIVHSLPQLPNGLAVNHPAYHPSLNSNPCEFSTCSHLCLLTAASIEGPLSASCKCPDHYALDDDQRCVPFNATERRRRQLDQAPEMCLSLLLQLCDRGEACMNGGKCIRAETIGGKVLSASCECPPGYVGHFCEVDLNLAPNAVPLGGGQSHFSAIRYFLVLIFLAGAGVFCWRNRSSVDLSRVTAKAQSLKAMSVQFGRMKRAEQSEPQRRILIDSPRVFNDTVEEEKMESNGGSFSNPVYAP